MATTGMNDKAIATATALSVEIVRRILSGCAASRQGTP
jgi:hypothetical protein